MPRPITVIDDTHRLEQAEYREGLAGPREAEIGRVDTTVTVAVYRLLMEIASSNPKRAGASPEEFIGRAADVLEAQGYNRERSVAVLRRRLERPPERFRLLLGIDVAEECAHYKAPA